MIDPTAIVSSEATIGEDTTIWSHMQVREGAQIGKNCSIGKGSYIGVDVIIGDNVKIQNACQIYRGAIIEDGVFIGPGAILMNDKYPRAVNPDGSRKMVEDWECGKILIRYGASIGAGSVILPNVTVGAWAMVGAGSVITRDVGDYELVCGNPARRCGYVGKDGRPQ